MEMIVRRWRVPSDERGPPVPQEAEFNTKREFESIFDSPRVADRILSIFDDNEWEDDQFIVRIPERVARRCGISTWKKHASLKVDPERETKDSIYVVESYTERGTLIPPGHGKTQEVEQPIPKTRIAFYEGALSNKNVCWNCGAYMITDRESRVYITSRRYFANEDYMPEQYPHPARSEYVCDDCTYGIVTTGDVDNFAKACVVCDRLKATCVERTVLPQSTRPHLVQRQYDIEELPSGVVCASCAEREKADYLETRLRQEEES